MSHKPTRLILTLLLILPLAACTLSARNAQGENWVIFSAERASEMGIGKWVAGKDQTVEYWTPTEEDMTVLESGLRDFLQSNSNQFLNQSETPAWERLDEYNRQYFGITLDGKNIVYGNFFCDNAGVEWRKNIVVVMDGGDCFFQFQYDPASGEYFNLRVNGSA